MTAKWYVIGSDNLTSWSEKTEDAECFKSEKQALARANEIANESPGQEIFVCLAVKRVLCAVLPPKASAC